MPNPKKRVRVVAETHPTKDLEQLANALLNFALNRVKRDQRTGARTPVPSGSRRQDKSTS